MPITPAISVTQPAAMMKDAEDCEMPYRQVAVHDRVDFGDQRAPGRIQQQAEIATEFGRQQLRQIGSFNWGSHQQKKSVLLSVSVILPILYRRWEERGVGHEGVVKCRSRWSP